MCTANTPTGRANGSCAGKFHGAGHCRAHHVCGVENLLRSEIGKGRALLTFAFGLIHGFGFVRVLRDMGLGQNGGSIVGPLFTFNVGVEAGQLTIVALVLPGLLWLQHANVHARRLLRPSLSGVIALIGLYWLLQRTAFA